MASEAEVVPPAAVKSASFAIVVPRRTAASSDFLKFPDDTSSGEEEAEVEIEPAYYSDGTKIPVFTPVSCHCYYCCAWRPSVWAVVVVRGVCADRI